MNNSPVIAVSSWALHRTLGAPPFWGVEGAPHGSDELHEALLSLPSQISAHGIFVMELCHFHLPTLEESFLTELRSRMKNAGVTLHALLVDDGDLTSPENGHRDMDWICEWLPIAAKLGAQKVRVIAGKSNGEKAAETSAMLLRLLARYADAQGLRLTTENWFPVLSSPAAVLQVLEQTEGRVGLNLDFGNWSGASKYDDLAAIAPHAESCHAKADFNADGTIVADDYSRCLALPYPSDFRGPFTLVAGGPSANDWDGIKASRDFILEYFSR